MINQQLVDYIKEQLKLGVLKEKISKDLLDNGWTGQDVDEGFKASVPTIASITQISPVPPASPAPSVTNVSNFSASPYLNRFNTTPPIQAVQAEQPKKTSSSKMLIVVFLIFFLVGGAAAFYFRDKLPFFQNIAVVEPNKNVEANNVLPQAQAPAPVAEVPPVPPVNTPNGGNVSNLPAFPAAEVTPAPVEVTDCGSDLICFVKAANLCQKSKLNVALVDKDLPMFKFGKVSTNTDYVVTGKEGDSCVAEIKISDFKLKYNADVVASFLKMGKSQADIEKMESDFSQTMSGATQICKLPATGKMGQALNKNLISLIDVSAKCGATGCTYSSGLVCQNK